MSKEKKSKKKVFTIILATIISLILIGVIGLYAYTRHFYSKMDNIEIDRDSVLNDTGRNPLSAELINILLIGVDNVDGPNGLSDTNIILTIDKKNNSIRLSSIMRDTHVNVPGYEDMNINEAILHGGPELLLKTINTNFNLDIDKFVKVNLRTLPQIIDKVGGIDLNITEDEFKWINAYIKDIDKKNNTSTELLKSSGNQHLNGTQATAYCRIRYTDGKDFKRTERQRDVLTLVIKKFTSLGLGDLYDIVNDCLPLVSTNLTYNEVFSLGKTVLSLDTSKVEQMRFPDDGDCWSTNTPGVMGSYKLNIDKEKTTEKMHKFIYGE